MPSELEWQGWGGFGYATGDVVAGVKRTGGDLQVAGSVGRVMLGSARRRCWRGWMSRGWLWARARLSRRRPGGSCGRC